MEKSKLFIIVLVSFIIGYGAANLIKDNKFQFLSKLQSHKSRSPSVVPKVPSVADNLTEKKTQIQVMISKAFPQLKVEELSNSPLPGVYQAIADSNEVFYSSQDGRYLLRGDLLDLTKQLDNLNQTEEVRKSIRLKTLATVPEKEMIIFKPKVVKGKVTVFTDVTCGFCQRFHKEINKIMDLGIEVRYLAYPRQGIDSDGYKKSVSVWCADDTKAMLTAAKNGENVPDKTCNSPVDKQYKLAGKLNINGTPTLLFSDGSMVPGYMPPDQLADFVFSVAPKTSQVDSSTTRKIKIQKMITRAWPQLKVEELSNSPLPGIYQVIANNEIFYASEDGKYLFHGDLLDVTNQPEHLSQTEEVRKSIRLKVLATIPENEMIIFRPKVVKGKVIVFTDVDCVFSQRFHKEINKIMDLGIEVRYLLFSRQGIGSDSYKKAVSVWCSDNSKAMLTAAKKGKTIPNRTCDTPIAKHHELAHRLNINGTPTLLFPDGSIYGGYMVPEQLAEFALKHQ
jgi:thiol:disulfide interchange protein DsbC